MKALEALLRWEGFDIEAFFEAVVPADVTRVLQKNILDERDFLVLLSPCGQAFLEPMARRAKALTLRHFGRVVQLYQPLYLADHCTNNCVYCGFRRTASMPRTRLTIEEIRHNARRMSETGIRHVLLLTGEAPAITPLSYLKEAVLAVRAYFSSISLEMHPMREDDYRELVAVGADGLTIYQETYDRNRYAEVHLSGRKRDFNWRLETPSRGCRSGFRAVNVGALYGLHEPRGDCFRAGLHARGLQLAHPEVEISLSFPRIHRAEPGLTGFSPVSDTTLVQLIVATRLFLPRAGIALSTREPARLRDHMMGIGVTRLSAGSSTEVGGYASSRAAQGQFVIEDTRSVDEVVEAIRGLGFDPVFKDWQRMDEQLQK
jgi:2-iminoacetate synthase